MSEERLKYKIETDGTFSIETEIIDQTLLKQLFGNKAGYNNIILRLKSINGMEFWLYEAPTITSIGVSGIVISFDTVGQIIDSDNNRNLGFHNFFVPWSNVVNIYQYIAT